MPPEIGQLPASLGDWAPVFMQYGYGLVILGAIFEGETVVTLGGVLAHTGVLAIYPTALCAALGAVVGDQIWFHLGRHFGRRLLAKMPRLSKHVGKAQMMLSKNADWVAVGARFVYGTRIAGPLLLGMHGYPAGRFLAINLLTGTIWAVLFTFLGYFLGAGVKSLLTGLRDVELLILAAIVLLSLRGLHYAYRRRQYERTRKQTGLTSSPNSATEDKKD